MRNWSIIGVAGAVMTVTSILISIFALIQDANSRYDNMVEEIKDCTYQINVLEHQLEILQDKLDLYEMEQSTSSKECSGNSLSDENEEEASLSSNEEETNLAE